MAGVSRSMTADTVRPSLVASLMASSRSQAAARYLRCSWSQSRCSTVPGPHQPFCWEAAYSPWSCRTSCRVRGNVVDHLSAPVMDAGPCGMQHEGTRQW